MRKRQKSNVLGFKTTEDLFTNSLVKMTSLAWVYFRVRPKTFCVFLKNKTDFLNFLPGFRTIETRGVWTPGDLTDRSLVTKTFSPDTWVVVVVVVVDYDHFERPLRQRRDGIYMIKS